MNDTLFDIPVCESPRLKWLREHKVSTHFNKDVQPGDEDEFSGETIYPWCAYVGPLEYPRADAGYGNTEHDAVVELAIINDWKLWNETI